MPSSCTDERPTVLPTLSAREIALGCPVGAVPLLLARAARVDPDPVRALRDAVRPALLRPPCVVAFSGGRDSALLLAVAADLAAREGLPAPIAVTFRYPGDPAADETAWQEKVLAHLGSRIEWIRRDITGELDVLGPLTTPVLREHGAPVYPAAVGNTVLLARYARGGSLVTGNGGDEVLGGHRAAVLRAVVRRRGRGLTGADWRLAATCAAPAPVRRHRARRVLGDAPWLRPPLRRALGVDGAARPLRFDRSVWSALAPRAVLVGRRTRAAVAGQYDCALVEPLGAADFVASYAAFGGPWGGLTRAEGTRLLAGELLPPEVVSRRDKAYFNASRFGAVSRAFAREWDGGGVDQDLVDPVALRAAWLSEVPPASTALLLQQAWLASAEER
ncbi:hypothetical protein DI005_10785 [Prauserella sp. PE36]|uniref:asparagine synthase-related protein n=1 Tax=Prauserella sp. PE36 TaxID=1504709 RepID=UPI000DE576E7|nr:asparagine synthase-related protein [Prauserella sp. PE36]RBM21300.1 hypothetical protein DI005_10785 [Prauserella sp. PE36]